MLSALLNVSYPPGIKTSLFFKGTIACAFPKFWQKVFDSNLYSQGLVTVLLDPQMFCLFSSPTHTL